MRIISAAKGPQMQSDALKFAITTIAYVTLCGAVYGFSGWTDSAKTRFKLTETESSITVTAFYAFCFLGSIPHLMVEKSCSWGQKYLVPAMLGGLMLCIGSAGFGSMFTFAPLSNKGAVLTIFVACYGLFGCGMVFLYLSLGTLAIEVLTPISFMRFLCCVYIIFPLGGVAAVEVFPRVSPTTFFWGLTGCLAVAVPSSLLYCNRLRERLITPNLGAAEPNPNSSHVAPQFSTWQVVRLLCCSWRGFLTLTMYAFKGAAVSFFAATCVMIPTSLYHPNSSTPLIFMVCNTIGRGVSAFLLLNPVTLGLPSVYLCLILFAITMLCGVVLFLMVSSPGAADPGLMVDAGIFLCSFAYGVQWPGDPHLIGKALPAKIVQESWSTLQAVQYTVTAVASISFTLLTGSIYDYHGQATQSGVKCFGRDCFEISFFLVAALSAVVLLMAAVLSYDFATQQKKALNLVETPLLT